MWYELFALVFLKICPGIFATAVNSILVKSFFCLNNDHGWLNKTIVLFLIYNFYQND